MPDSPISLPRMAFRVGFVGHRELDASAIDALKQQVASVLKEIEERLTELKPDPDFQDIYSAEPPRLIFISSLAKGADLLGCEIAQKRGWALHAVLPFNPELFQQEDQADHD